MNKYNWKVKISYDGNYTGGWEGDKEKCVKSFLQNAIKKFSGEIVRITCAGRTDAGVHAIGQICSFKLSKKFDKNSVLNGINFFLPKFIRILEAKRVKIDFSARFSAKYRIYRYFIVHKNLMPAVLLGKCLYLKNELCIKTLKEAANHLIGKYDISTFCPNKYPGRRVRTITDIKILNTNIFGCKATAIEFKAQSFAHHQVRNMIGCLISVGFKKWTIKDLMNKVLNKDRTEGANTAQPHGLYLWKIIY